jgi:peptide/nickel transport system substrate-binding protein
MEPLVGIDETGVIQEAGLLTEWERPSPTTWRFAVREGVEFHNGEPFNATAVKRTLEIYMGDAETRSGAFLGVVTDAVVVDEATLDITTNAPYIALPQVLSQIYALPPTHYESIGGDAFANAPVGTGPFKFESRLAGQSVSVSAFDSYWGDKAHLDGIDFSFASDARSRASLLEADGADLVIDVPVEQVESIEGNPRLKMETAASTSTMTMIFETDKPPFDDKAVREAAAKAIDRDTLSETIFRGTAGATPFFIGDLMTDSGSGGTVDYDLEGAKSIVSDLAVAPRVSLTYTIGAYPKDGDVGEAIAGMLEAAGFQVDRNPTDIVQMLELRTNNALDVYIYQVVPVYLHPDVYTAYFVGTDARVKLCASPELDQLKRDAVSAPDVEASEEVYRSVEDVVLNDEICLLPLFNPVATYGMSAEVQGFVAPKNHLPNWAAVSLSE